MPGVWIMTAAVDPEDYPREMVKDACHGATTVYEVAQELRVRHESARWLLNHYNLSKGSTTQVTEPDP